MLRSYPKYKAAHRPLQRLDRNELIGIVLADVTDSLREEEYHAIQLQLVVFDLFVCN